MSKWKEEHKYLFSDVEFSSESKQIVLSKLTKKKSFSWKSKMALTVIVAIASILIFLSIKVSDQVSVSSIDRSTIEGFFDSFYNNENEEIKSQLLHKQLNVFHSNDAVIVSKYIDNSNYYILSYLEKDEAGWYVKSSTSISPVKMDEEGAYYTLLKFDNRILVAGWLPNKNASSQIYVGNKEAIYLEMKDRIWIQEALTMGSPVFMQSPESKKIRLLQTPDYFSVYDQLPVVLKSENQILYENKSDVMVGIAETFDKYKLVVDPDYYEQYTPSIGEVVVIEKDGQQYLTRIKGVGGGTVTISEGSILFNDYFFETRYMMAQINGNINVDFTMEPVRIYLLNEQQYFVQSDNWGSDDFYEGIIMKEDIIGKVVGYSLLNIEPKLTEEDANLYKRYRETYEDTLLAGLKAHDIYRLQKYALYKGDYETAYHLFDHSTIGLTKEEWITSYTQMDNEIMKHKNAYLFNIIGEANEEMSGNKILYYYESSNFQQTYLGTMSLIENVYKVEYSETIDISIY